MSSAKITSKGQVTIPQEVRQAMGVSEGDRVEFVHMDDGSFAVYPVTKPVSALKGIIPLRRKPATLEEMDVAVAAGAASGLKARVSKAKK